MNHNETPNLDVIEFDDELSEEALDRAAESVAWTGACDAR